MIWVSGKRFSDIIQSFGYLSPGKLSFPQMDGLSEIGSIGFGGHLNHPSLSSIVPGKSILIKPKLNACVIKAQA